jgi:hypothetical protein
MNYDASKFKPFYMHFSLHIEYATTKKYLVDRKEKQLIKKIETNTKLGYNVPRVHLSCDPIYWK